MPIAVACPTRLCRGPRPQPRRRPRFEQLAAHLLGRRKGRGSAVRLSQDAHLCYPPSHGLQEEKRMSARAWLRRLVASVGVGATSYAIMIGIMLVSVLYDKETEPLITWVSHAGRSIVSGFDQAASGSHWG